MSAVTANRSTQLPPAELIYEGSLSWKCELGRTVLSLLTAPLIIGLVVLLADWIRRSNTKYRITTQRIEWQKGILSRRIDGIDLWRVRHVEYVQTLADRMFGLSRLEVFSQDQEDPHLVLKGLPADRSVYDQVAAASQGARRGTVGIIQ